MKANRILCSACGALALLVIGCADVMYTPASSHDEVLRTSQRRVRGDDVEVRAWQSGTELRLQARWRCDVVEWNDIRRTTIEEPDADFAGDYALLGLAAIPTGFGIGLLADSGNVYEDDRNSREYNPAGPAGAIAGGVVLLTLGTVMIVVPAADLIVSSESVETEELVEEQGQTLRRGVACPRPEPAAGVVVAGLLRAQGSADATSYPLGTTDELGRLSVDLALALPPNDLARAALASSLEVRAGAAVAGHADLSPVRLAQQQRLREADDGQWMAAEPESCRRSPSEQSCQGVRDYLELFPDGLHAAQARDALGALASVTLVQAEAPTEDDEATAKARDEVKAACQQSCSRACKRKTDCVERCVEEVCP